MSAPVLAATLREKGGKGAARAARREGFVPGVIYGNKKDPIKINMNFSMLLKNLRAGHFLSTLLTLDVEGKKEMVLCRDVQRAKVNGLPIHVDFMRVTAKQKVEVFVPVVYLNEEECKGIKKGGSLVEVRNEVELYVPVTQIPDSLELDLTDFDIGDVIHISNFKLPEGAELVIDDRDFVIANISAPMEEEVEEEVEDEGAAVAEGEEAEGDDGDEEKGDE